MKKKKTAKKKAVKKSVRKTPTKKASSRKVTPQASQAKRKSAKRIPATPEQVKEKRAQLKNMLLQLSPGFLGEWAEAGGGFEGDYSPDTLEEMEVTEPNWLELVDEALDELESAEMSVDDWDYYIEQAQDITARQEQARHHPKYSEFTIAELYPLARGKNRR